MKRLITRLLMAVGLISAFAMPAVVVTTAHAAPIDVFQACSGSDSQVCKNQSDQKLFGPNSIWTKIVNTIIFLTGSIATIMIVVGGLRYVMSGGDSAAVNGAKNTILYAIVGIVVAVMAYAIVNFVLTRIG